MISFYSIPCFRMVKSLHIFIVVFIFSRNFGYVQSVRNTEPECGCGNGFQLIYSHMEETITLKQEVKDLKEIVAELQAKLREIENDVKGNIE